MVQHFAASRHIRCRQALHVLRLLLRLGNDFFSSNSIRGIVDRVHCRRTLNMPKSELRKLLFRLPNVRPPAAHTAETTET